MGCQKYIRFLAIPLEEIGDNQESFGFQGESATILEAVSPTTFLQKEDQVPALRIIDPSRTTLRVLAPECRDHCRIDCHIRQRFLFGAWNQKIATPIAVINTISAFTLDRYHFYQPLTPAIVYPTLISDLTSTCEKEFCRCILFRPYC